MGYTNTYIYIIHTHIYACIYHEILHKIYNKCINPDNSTEEERQYNVIK